MNTPPDQFPPPGGTAKTEPLATLSLVFGLLSLACFSVLTGVPAIICGHTARTRINQSNGTLAGREMAVIGMVLGYISVAVSIVAVIFTVLIAAGTISLALLAQKAPQLQQSAAQPIVTLAAGQISSACMRYKNDNHQFPPPLSANDEEVDATALFAALAIADNNGVPYYSPDGSGIHINGIPCDTWAQPLHVALDLNGDGKVNVGGTNIPASSLIWSSGPDHQNDHGAGDDVKSW
jgi:hypothetical protein